MPSEPHRAKLENVACTTSQYAPELHYLLHRLSAVELQRMALEGLNTAMAMWHPEDWEAFKAKRRHCSRRDVRLVPHTPRYRTKTK